MKRLEIVEKEAYEEYYLPWVYQFWGLALSLRDFGVFSDLTPFRCTCGNMHGQLLDREKICWWSQDSFKCYRFFDWGASQRPCKNGFIWPVLKHGPRSITNMRAFEWQTHRRNESKYKMRWATCSIDPRNFFCIVRSKSISVMTRKMVNYAWVGWSLGKLRWKLVAVLTCKSFVQLEYRGERLIEPSSSWFPPKFLSG